MKPVACTGVTVAPELTGGVAAGALAVLWAALHLPWYSMEQTLFDNRNASSRSFCCCCAEFFCILAGSLCPCVWVVWVFGLDVAALDNKI